MNDKYKLLQDNPKICKRLFGIKFELLEIILVKVQNYKNSFLQENPTSNRGIDGEFSIPNQLLLTLEYLRQYPTFLSLGFSYGISESYTHKIFHNSFSRTDSAWRVPRRFRTRAAGVAFPRFGRVCSAHIMNANESIL